VTQADLAVRRLATHQAFYALYPHVAPAPGVVASVVPEAPSRSLFNAVIYRDPRAIGLMLPHLADVYERAGVGAWTVWVLPGDERLTPLLADAGHRLDGTPEGMGAVLADLDLSGPDVDVAGGSASYDEIVATNAAAYGVPEQELAPMRLAGDAMRLYRAEGGAVVLGILEHEGDAGVTYVAARPEARGRGLVGTLLRQALRESLERGCTTTTLESTKLGRPVYERLGFRSVGTLQMWERRARR
jgi:ribosomal protein S18 acetylase RimI-like enzyme